MSEGDRQCLQVGHPEYLQLVRPESMRQGTATGALQDLRLYTCPWSFSPSHIPEALQRHTHIWHGTGDLQARFHAYATSCLIQQHRALAIGICLELKVSLPGPAQPNEFLQ